MARHSCACGGIGARSSMGGGGRTTFGAQTRAPRETRRREERSVNSGAQHCATWTRARERGECALYDVNARAVECCVRRVTRLASLVSPAITRARETHVRELATTI